MNKGIHEKRLKKSDTRDRRLRKKVTSLSRKVTILMLLIGVGVVSSGLAVRAFTRHKEVPTVELRETKSAAASTPIARSAQSLPADDGLQAKLVTLTPRGFEPDELLVTQKTFLLAIEKESRLKGVLVHLSRVGGTRFHDTRMVAGQNIWNDVFSLPSGEYLLTEENNPEWVCKITVNLN